MTRVYNFSAGPSQLPLEVLRKAQKELLEYGNSGQSVMEMSHRSQDFMEIMEACEQQFRNLMNIPDNYKVLFLQGGASLQFTMIPMNLFTKYKKAAVIHTGQWTKKAIKELKKLGECEIIASSEDETYAYIPEISNVPNDVDYVYMCENNTIYGTKYKSVPETNGIPLVSDMSSCILSEPVDVKKYGLIFAGAQKNMGIAGLTVVIIREDLIQEQDALPSMLSYHVAADNDSMFNTPPTFAIYMLSNVLQWISDTFGTLENLKLVNEKKAALLYDFLDSSKMFKGTVRKEDRSLMNIPFVTTNPELDKKFIKEAKEQGFVNLKGHRSVGGMRASIYNAMPIEDVEKLVAFMKKFESENES